MVGVAHPTSSHNPLDRPPRQIRQPDLPPAALIRQVVAAGNPNLELIYLTAIDSTPVVGSAVGEVRHGGFQANDSANVCRGRNSVDPIW